MHQRRGECTWEGGDMIEAALNGGRGKAEHSGCPTTPQELAKATRGALQEGAAAIHLHVRCAGGAESLSPDDVAPATQAPAMLLNLHADDQGHHRAADFDLLLPLADRLYQERRAPGQAGKG